MWMVSENPGRYTPASLSHLRVRKCKRCGGDRVFLTWSRYIDGPHYDRKEVIRYGCECYHCEESNMTKRRFMNPEQAARAWNELNASMGYTDESEPVVGKTTRASLPSDIDMLKRH